MPDSERFKKVHSVVGDLESHWVGDGFKVQSKLSLKKDLLGLTSPFLLMDYAPPQIFPKTDKKLGVGEHPHRGFETLTFALQGEVQHRDSSGGGGLISQGDVQWMTAGSGIVHEEFHSERFAQEGGVFEMLQIWINLPADKKMMEPKYQSLKRSSFPKIKLENGIEIEAVAGEIGSGEYQVVKGPAISMSPINIFRVSMDADQIFTTDLLDESNTLVMLLEGVLKLGSQTYTSGDLLVFERSSDLLKIESLEPSDFIVLNSKPIEEPVAHYGPFVMNTNEEIRQAIRDYESGKMGKLE